MPSIGDVFLSLRADDRKFRQEVISKGGAAGDAGGKAAGEKMSSRIGATLREKSNLIAAGGGAALGAFVADSAREFAQFEQGMNEVFTLLPGIQADAMAEMTSQVKDFSNEFGRLPEEVVPALYQSLSAGVDKDNVFDFLETANKLAVGGAAQTSEAVGVLASVTKGYGDTSEEATAKVSDLLFTTVRLGTTTIPELSASIGKAIPQAAALNVAQEELFATTAALTGVTGNTAEVATQMKATFQALLVPTADMKRGLADIGFESGKAAIESLGLQGTLEALRASTNGNDEAFTRMLSSSEAITAGLSITGQRADAVRENMEQMGEATGATDEAFARMDQGVQATANRIGARIKTLMLDVGGAIAPIGPILTAFGPTIGRALGGAFGAGFGLLINNLPRLMGPVLAKMAALIGASQFGASLGGNITSALGQPGFLGKLKALGGGWGRVLGVGAAAAMAVIIAKQLAELGDIRRENEEQARAISEQQQELFDQGLSREEAQAQLDALKGMREEADGIAGAILDIGGAASGNVFGSIVDGVFGANPEQVRQESVRALEEYLSSDLPELAAKANQKAEQIGGAVGEGVTDGLVDELDPATVTQELEEAGVFDGVEDVGVEAGEQAGKSMAESIADAMKSANDGADLDTIIGQLPENVQDAFRESMKAGFEDERFASLIESGIGEPWARALTALGGDIKDNFRAARKLARAESALLGPSIREGIKSGRQTVRDAMADLRFAMTNPMKAVRVIAKIEGALTSKRLRDGLRSNDPLVKRQALRTKAQLIEQWEDLTGETWDWGAKTGENLGKGIKARRRDARRDAQATADAAGAPLEGVAGKADNWGEAITEAFARGLRTAQAIQAVVAAAGKVVGKIADLFKPGSPTKEGPLSKEGGTEGWGERLSHDLGIGLDRGAGFDIAQALGLSSLDPLPLALAASRRAHGLGVEDGVGNGAGGTTINMETYGLPMRAQTPLEVMEQMSRGARLGAVAPKRTARFALTGTGQREVA